MSNGEPYPWQAHLWQQFCAQKQRERIAHAYLLAGSAGLGKSRFAQSMAAILLCEQLSGNNPCDRCRACTLRLSGSQPDLLEVAPEEGSKVIKIDQIRELAEFTGKTSHGKRHKVVILYNAEAMHPAATNALLKTLEEPPGKTVLILTSSRPGSLLATLRSRCQKILFGNPEPSLVKRWLIDQLGESDSIDLLIQTARGSPLQALQMADDGSLDNSLKLIRGLAGMWVGKLPAMDMVQLCKQLDFGHSVTQFYQTSSILIRYLISGAEVSASVTPDHNLIMERLAVLEPDAKNQALRSLLHINRSADVARRQLSSSANPNPGLILQSLVREWQQLAMLTPEQ